MLQNNLSNIWKRITDLKLNWTRDYENGMGISLGRLRKDHIYDY